jgi:hypothetical protein
MIEHPSNAEVEALRRLPLAVRIRFLATWADIARLPQTRFEPFVPPWMPIDWSGDRPGFSRADAEAVTRTVQEIRDLPVVNPQRR